MLPADAGRQRGHRLTEPTGVVRGDDLPLLREAVERAVDFRGDVTIETRDGRVIVGFAFDARRQSVDGSAVDVIRVLPTETTEKVSVRLGEIRTLAFTGKDAASGRNWEAWIRRYAEKKLAGESASIESEPL